MGMRVNNYSIIWVTTTTYGGVSGGLSLAL